VSIARLYNLDRASDRAQYRAHLDADRERRAADLARKRETGEVKSPSANRKRKRHGRR
jgi:hypothetical protein